MTILFRPQGAFGWFSYTTSRDTIQQVIVVLQLFFAHAQLLADAGWVSLNAQQPVNFVVCIILTGITVELGQQAANRIALEQRIPFRMLTVLAVANLIEPGQIAACVIAEASGHVVDPHFFNQAVRCVIGKAYS